MTYPISTTRSSRGRKILGTAALTIAGLVFAGALTAAAVNDAAQGKSSVSLQVDGKPVNRSTLEPASYSKVIKQVAPSVVKITIEKKGRIVEANPEEAFGIPDPLFRQFFGGRTPRIQQAPQAGLGSGVIVSTDGYIVTNNHVVEGADKVLVSLDDGRELKAKIVGRDPQTDVAVVKVDAKDLKAIVFADSTNTEVGDRVLALGNPFGIGETVTTGIISAKGRRPGLGLAYEDFIQTDAAINPGNSGGPLVDIDGRLIGINTAILSRSGGFQGVGLAVPSNLVRHVVDSLVATGKVVRGYMGVSIQNLSPALAESFGVEAKSGAIISDVVTGSPADKAGLKSGDIIEEVDGAKVTESADISLKVGQTAPGSKVDLKIKRGDKSEKVSVTVGTMPKNRNFAANNNGDDEDDDSPSLSFNGGDNGVLNGVAVADIDSNARRELNIPMRLRGALVTDVSQDSASAKAGIKAGDIILEINHKPVKNADEAIKLSEQSGNKKTLLKLWSRGSTIYTVVDESESAS